MDQRQVTCTPVEIRSPEHDDVIRADVRVSDRGDPRTAVVVAHGFKGFKDWGFFPVLCESLAQDGHLVVAFNGSLNGVGASRFDFTDLDAFGRNTVSRETADLHRVVECAATGELSGERRPDAIAVLGHSRGGGSAVVVAAERDDVASLVTWAGNSTFHRWTQDQVSDWMTAGVTYVENARTGQLMPLRRVLYDDLAENAGRFDILARAGQVRAPWLVVHGSEDATVTPDEARRLAAAGRRAELHVVDGAAHTFDAVHPLADIPEALAAAIRATRRHLRDSLRAAGACQ